MIQDTVDLALFFSLRPQYAAIGDCCYPVDASCQLADVPAVNELPESELFFQELEAYSGMMISSRKNNLREKN